MLEFKNVNMTFTKSKKEILKNINFNLSKGEIVGLIGANGAGKTTLMKLISKSRKPTSGEILYNGKNLHNENNLLHDVGLMIDPVFYPHLSPRKNIEFYLKINNQRTYMGDISNILKLVGLSHVENKPVKSFSFGMKQRCCLAICLITKPNLAIMDEPFVGLDPEGVKQLINTLKTYANENQMTILISSHQLNELESVCDRFLFLKNGSIKELFKNTERKQTLYFNNDFDNFYVQKLFDKFDFITKIEGKTITLVEASSDLQALLSEVSNTHQLIKMESNKNDLYELFDDNGVM